MSSGFLGFSGLSDEVDWFRLRLRFYVSSY
jgi:hypothetical protein